MLPLFLPSRPCIQGRGVHVFSRIWSKKTVDSSSLSLGSVPTKKDFGGSAPFESHHYNLNKETPEGSGHLGDTEDFGVLQ